MPTNQLSPRGRRAVGLSVLALVVIAAAGFGYLRSNATLATKPTIEVPITKTVLATPDPVSYEFVTPSIGWAVENLNTPTTPAGGFAVFKTTDGAKHWQKQLQLESSFVGFVPLSVQFIDQAHGFIAVGDPFEQLNRTTDGGATWNSLPLPRESARVGGFAFTDTSHGWLLAGRQANHLYQTLDAGDSWQMLPDPPLDADYLSLRRATLAWMGSFGLQLGPPHVYTSIDGGQSWQRHNLPRPTPGGSWDAEVGYQVLDELLPGRGVVVSTFCECAPSGPFHFTSFDGGLTWGYVQFPPGVVGYQGDLLWWVINARTLGKSSDAGQTWTKVSDRLPDWQFSIPHILDSKHAWAMLFVMGGYGLALTSDGGLHWTQANVPLP